MSAYNDNPNLTGQYVWITADDTASRRSRGAQIAAERRRYSREYGVRLELLAKSYSESPGFLHRSSFRYRIWPTTDYLARLNARIAATSPAGE